MSIAAEELFRDGPRILDGGLATELEARGGDLSGGLWSAKFLLDAPEKIVGAHEAFFSAGAEVAKSAGYQASFEGFAEHGVGPEQATELMRRSVELAGEAAHLAPVREQVAKTAAHRTGRLVAASVGPYGAMLADGSEYRGRYGIGHRALVDFHRPRLEAFAAAAPDLFALETVPDVDEAVALLDALDGLGVSAWLSFTISGDRTRAGQPLEEAFAVAADRDDVLAVGVNCCSPADATRAVPIARAVSGKPVVVYPNSGESWDAERQVWTGRSGFDAALVTRWVTDGAGLVGGCCRVAPADIAELTAHLHRPDQ
ncbi:homocysteine S-methyltransferase [Saccharopolyspora gloriosae]|uniref:homocysteine S-methyltransferase n=1 Tax=Saccharopolyspora gloriosae TaxID=455344 RepID=UPI001FB5A9C8|nr:homocysteine S-methyltransferase [Saccharopolyspora gloriosae]